MNLETWLEDLAAKQATPGGGASAGLALATAAALIGMVSIYTTGVKWADRETDMLQINTQATHLRQQALGLMQADEAAFAAVGAAFALPRQTADEKEARQLAIQGATKAAAEPPRQVAVAATEVITLAAVLVNQGNPNVVSDVGVAASLARAAIESAIVNIAINQKMISDAALQTELNDSIEACRTAMTQADAVVLAVQKRIAG